MFHLPTEIRELIFEMSGSCEAWKRRFSNDVLSQINKGYRVVGMFCSNHYDDACDCQELVPCANCYCYSYDLCDHRKYDQVTFDEIRSHCALTSYYIPMEVFMYFCVSNVDFTKPYTDTLDRFMHLSAFKKELQQKIANKA